MNDLTKDFKEFLQLLEKHKVKFLVCGGHAVGFYGYPRLTMDFDMLIYPSKANAARVMAALDEFGFGKAGIPLEAFLREGSAITLGVQPNQIDLLTSVSAQPVAEIFKNAVQGKLEGFDVLFIAKEDLISAKKSSKRLKDRADAEELEKIP